MENGSFSLKQLRWLLLAEDGDLIQNGLFSVGDG